MTKPRFVAAREFIIRCETFNPIRQQLAVQAPFLNRITIRNSNNFGRYLFNTLRISGGTLAEAVLRGMNPLITNSRKIYQYNLTIERHWSKIWFRNRRVVGRRFAVYRSIAPLPVRLAARRRVTRRFRRNSKWRRFSIKTNSATRITTLCVQFETARGFDFAFCSLLEVN